MATVGYTITRAASVVLIRKQRASKCVENLTLKKTENDFSSETGQTRVSGHLG